MPTTYVGRASGFLGTLSCLCKAQGPLGAPGARALSSGSLRTTTEPLPGPASGPRPWNLAEVEARPEALEDKQTRRSRGPLTMWGKSGVGGATEKKSLEKSDNKPKTGSPRSTASKADKRKKMYSMCLPGVLFLQDLMQHMVTHRREAVQVPDLKVDLFLEAQPGALPGVHQKALHRAPQQGQ